MSNLLIAPVNSKLVYKAAPRLVLVVSKQRSKHHFTRPQSTYLVAQLDYHILTSKKQRNYYNSTSSKQRNYHPENREIKHSDVLQSTYEGRLECMCQPRKKILCVDDRILGSLVLEQPLKKFSVLGQVINSVEPFTILGCLKVRKSKLRLHSQTRKYFSEQKVLF